MTSLVKYLRGAGAGEEPGEAGGAVLHGLAAAVHHEGQSELAPRAKKFLYLASC